jgi:hypothetical protein
LNLASFASGDQIKSKGHSMSDVLHIDMPPESPSHLEHRDRRRCDMLARTVSQESVAGLSLNFGDGLAGQAAAVMG